VGDNARAAKEMHVDLDNIHDPDPAQTERNLQLLLSRIRAMGGEHGVPAGLRRSRRPRHRLLREWGGASTTCSHQSATGLPRCSNCPIGEAISAAKRSAQRGSGKGGSGEKDSGLPRGFAGGLFGFQKVFGQDQQRHPHQGQGHALMGFTGQLQGAGGLQVLGPAQPHLRTRSNVDKDVGKY
jgi:hypothetical protein